MWVQEVVPPLELEWVQIIWVSLECLWLGQGHGPSVLESKFMVPGHEHAGQTVLFQGTGYALLRGAG